MRILLALLVAAELSAAEKKSEPAKPSAPVTLTELQAIKFENLALKEQLTRQSLAQVTEEQNALVAAVCKEAGIPVGECSINLRTRQVGKVAKIGRRDNSKQEGK